MGDWRLLGALLLILLPAGAARSQTPGADPASPPAAPQERTSTTEQDAGDPFAELVVEELLGVCAPPSTQEQVMIGVGTLLILVVCFVLLVRLVERRFITQDRSPQLGRHMGFSLTIFMTSLGFVTLVYLVTGCVHSKFFWWLGFAAALWLIHLVYTLVVVRN